MSVIAQATPVLPNTYEPPRGKFKDGICDCFTNLWPSCLCVSLNNAGIFPMFYAGQISSRIGWVKTVPLLITYLVLLFIAFAVTIAGAVLGEMWDPIYLLPALFALVFLIWLRYKFVSFYSIEEGGLLTCCTAFWCAPCSLCQMGRHLYGYTKRFDGDGDLEGNMSYTTPANADNA